MQTKTLKHIWYYLALVAVEVSGLFAVFYFTYDKHLQMLVVALMTLFYVVWATLHHQLHHDLHPKIVLEYILIGILGFLIVFFFLKI